MKRQKRRVLRSVNSVHAAKRVIHDHEVIVLGKRDREVFIGTLLNPPEPNQKLRQAFVRYQRLKNKESITDFLRGHPEV